MIIYSLTVRVKSDIANEWLQWMTEEHIPNVLSTGYFNGHKIFKILIPETEKDYIVYRVNYELESFEKYTEYAQKEAKRLQEEAIEKYHGKFTASREVIEKI
jgi:Domain of unknown function (DUF4286)